MNPTIRQEMEIQAKQLARVLGKTIRLYRVDRPPHADHPNDPSYRIETVVEGEDTPVGGVEIFCAYPVGVL